MQTNLLFIENLELDFFNPRSIICFIAILQGAIFAVLLFSRFFKHQSKADLWLGGLLGVLCLSLVTPFIGFANVYDRNQWLTYFPFSIAYSYGVCVWFYTLNLTDSKREFQAKDLFLFLPTLVYLAYRFFLFAHSLEWKAWFGENYGDFFGTFIFITETIWNIVFLYFAVRHYRKYRVWLNENYSDTEKIKFDWLRNFLYIFTAVLIFGALFDFTNSFLFKLSYIQYFYFELVLACVTYYLAIAGYLRSKTIELQFSEKQAEEAERKMLLTEKELQSLKNKLQGLMQNEKLYLEPNLTLTDLSKNLGVNSSILSYVINNGFGKNFNDFINEFRIEEVKNKLKTANDSTLLGIAFDCGFNSKATFNRAFKKFTGFSPKEFQENSGQN
ncbi:MAG TPA: helix-turn-helix domain-containing protein [Pyrinomonadaceae bacterium]|nr:helix-turn-helix domain-containing protein [Pyrinomonadaceae bacterium]